MLNLNGQITITREPNLSTRERWVRQDEREQHQAAHDVNTCRCLDAKTARYYARLAEGVTL